MLLAQSSSGEGDAVSWDGSVWSSPQMIYPDGSLSAISCATASFCMAVGGTDAVAFSTSNAPPAGGAALRRCHASVLSARPYVLASGGAAGSVGGAFGLVNDGARACTLFGYPGLELLGASGRPLPTTVVRGQYEVVGAVPELAVTLSPGAQAYFYFMYSDALGGGTPGACPEAPSIEITPPSAYHHLVFRYRQPSQGTAMSPCEGRIWVSPVTTSTPFPLVALYGEG
jgi:hypothetical protein